MRAARRGAPQSVTCEAAPPPCAVRAQAATAEIAPTTNVRGAMLPPSAGTPTWSAVIEVGGAQQIVSEGRFYSTHSLDVRLPRAPPPFPPRPAPAAEHYWPPGGAGEEYYLRARAAVQGRERQAVRRGAVRGGCGHPQKKERGPHAAFCCASCHVSSPPAYGGSPRRSGAKVHAEILEHYRDDKIIIFKMKAKKHYRKKTARGVSAFPAPRWSFDSPFLRLRSLATSTRKSPFGSLGLGTEIALPVLRRGTGKR